MDDLEGKWFTGIAEHTALVRCADVVFVLTRVNSIGREGDCEWMAEPMAASSPWRLQCVKHRTLDIRNQKPLQVSDTLATLMMASAEYCGYAVPRKDTWVICFTGTNLYLETRAALKDDRVKGTPAVGAQAPLQPADEAIKRMIGVLLPSGKSTSLGPQPVLCFSCGRMRGLCGCP